MDLGRFHNAQAAIWPAPLEELRAGRKASHWMWFVFPQLASLGRSGTAKFYGLADLAEARAYLADPLLRERLLAATRAMLAQAGQPAEAILGPVDALKLRSSMTLFERAGGEGHPEFAAVLAAFYDGQRCPVTQEAP